MYRALQLFANLFGGFMTRITRGLALLGACTLWAACSKSDNGSAGATTAADTSAAAAAAAPAPAPAMNDTTILGTLDALNGADSSFGSVAATKGTNASVKAFGKEMMRDHHKLRADGQALAKKLGVTPEAPSNDDSKAQYDKTMSLYNGATKGKDFDKAYIDNEVTYHTAVLETATNAMNAAQNAELKNFIQKAAPAIQAHLDNAKSIQSKLQ